MNLLDKAIAYVSPEAAARRLRARAVLQQVARLSYDAAASGRRTGGWLRPGTSANAEVGTAIKQLRDSVRDLYRNNPLGRKAISELTTKAVGSGIAASAATGDAALNKRLDDKWRAFSAQCNTARPRTFNASVKLGAKTIFESGEVITRFRPRRPEDGLTVPLQFQMLEPDYIDHTNNGELDQGYIIQGVEHDSFDREVACWMFGTHPGDVVNTGFFKKNALVAKRVPVRTDNPLDGLERAFVVERLGQVRGVPWGVASIMAMYDLDGYKDAERVRKRIEACLAAFITSEQSDESGNPVLGAQTQDSSGKTVEEFQPGMITRLRVGENITSIEPKAAPGTDSWVIGEERTIAAGWQIPFEILTGNLSQTNYSSYRGGLLSFKDVIEDFQWNVLIPGVCDPIWRHFVDACKVSGYVPPDTPYDVEWGPPAFDLLDREAEAKASVRQARAGELTFGQLCRRQGYDPMKQLDEIEFWAKEFDRRGIVLDIDPRKVAITGAVQKADPLTIDNPPQQTA